MINLRILVMTLVMSAVGYHAKLQLQIAGAAEPAEKRFELDAADCASMLSALRNNYDSVSSYDLLLQYERQEDGEGHSISFKRRIRVAVDQENQRLAVVSFKEEVDNVARTQRSSAESILMEKSRVLRTNFLGPPEAAERQGLQSVLQEAGVANVLMIGASFFPNGIYGKKEIVEQWDKTIGSISTFGKGPTGSASEGKFRMSPFIYPRLLS